MLADLTWQSMFEMPQLAIVGGLAIGFLISMVAIIAHYWHMDQKLHTDNALRRTLVEQGMSVDEIEGIMNAGREGQTKA